MDKTTKIINAEVSSHKEATEDAMNKMAQQQQVVALLKEKGSTPDKMLIESSKLALIKDKILFHKAAILTLEDLLEKLK